MAWFQKSVAGLVARGVRKAARGEYDLAITDFSAAIQLLEPDDLFEYVEVFTCRADAYADDGQYDNALADYDKAIKNARSIMNSTGHLWRFSPSALSAARSRLAKYTQVKRLPGFARRSVIPLPPCRGTKKTRPASPSKSNLPWGGSRLGRSGSNSLRFVWQSSIGGSLLGTMRP
jgi:tetratricopeptide (TPR) repeat protein